MLRRSLFAGFLLPWLWLTMSCQVFSQPVVPRIAVSKSSPNYENWLKRSNPAVVPVNLYALPIDSAVKELSRCGALLLTGGEDVYPGWYGMAYDTARCTEMNRHRDSLEMALIAKALEMKMPLFAVCRGNQILNVFLKGTLIIDIPKDIGTKVIHQSEDYLHCFHPVIIQGKTLLSTISHCDSAMVTSNHHQAVGRLAPVLTANAFAGDQVVEGIEWKQPSGKSFLLGVQWHPERMEKSNPLSGPLADEFTSHAAFFTAKNQLKTKK
ncbi:MAG: type 1 glutamine amidotransferase [Bacteroidota bacterium]